MILNYLLASLVSQKLNITLLDIFGFNYLLMLGKLLILLPKKKKKKLLLNRKQNAILKLRL